MVEETKNLRKFLESDDPAMVIMGLSMAKGSRVPEEMLGLVTGLYLWHDDKAVRAAAKSAFMKLVPDELKQILKETWKIKYRTIKNHFNLKTEMINLATHLKGTSLDTIDLWLPAFSRTSGDKISIIYALGKVGDKRAVEPLIRVLKGWRMVGRDAQYYEETIWKDKNWPPIEGANYGELDTYRSLEESFVEIGESAVRPLIEALNYENPSAIEVALTALGRIKDKRAVDPIIKKYDEDADLRPAAIVALGGLGDERAIPFLIKNMAENQETTLNFFFLKSLYKLGHADSVKEIIMSWKDIEIVKKYITTIREKPFGIKEIINALGEEHRYVDKTNQYHEYHKSAIRHSILHVLTMVILDNTVSFTKKEAGNYWNFLSDERRRTRFGIEINIIKEALEKIGHKTDE